jgi:hypothetical protein
MSQQTDRIVQLVYGFTTKNFNKVLRAMNGEPTMGSVDSKLLDKQIRDGIYTTPIFSFHTKVFSMALHADILVCIDMSVLNMSGWTAFTTECGGGTLSGECHPYTSDSMKEYISKMTELSQSTEDIEDWDMGEVILPNKIKLLPYIRHIIFKEDITSDQYNSLARNLIKIKQKSLSEYIHIRNMLCIDKNSKLTFPYNTITSDTQTFRDKIDTLVNVYVSSDPETVDMVSYDERVDFVCMHGYEIEENGLDISKFIIATAECNA